MKHYLVLALLLFGSQAFSQSHFKPGFVVLNSGDSIHGLVDYRGDYLMSTVCKFKTDETAKVQTFLPKEISGYRFTDGKYFESKEILTSGVPVSVFLEFLIKGELNIYYYKDKEGDHYLVEKEGLGLQELPYKKSKIESSEGGSYIFSAKRHIGVLKLYMADVPELNSKIEGIKEPGHTDLIKIAEEYHFKSCGEKNCIVYEKKPAVFQLSIEPGLHITNYGDRFLAPDFLDRNYLFWGGFLYLSVPGINEKIFIRTGYFHTQIEVKSPPVSKYSYQETQKPNTLHSFSKVPIHIGYLFPKGIVQPKLAYGVNLYTNMDFYAHPTTSLSGGLNIRVFKSLFYSIVAESEFYSQKTLLLPKGWYSFSAQTGLYLKL